MNVRCMIEKLVNLYHNDFNSRTLVCSEGEKIIIKWYSNEYGIETIDTGIVGKNEGIKLYDILCEYINFIQLSYELECLRKK